MIIRLLRTSLIFFSLLLAGVINTAQLAPLPSSFQLIRITPSGENIPVSATHQLIFEFNKAVVPLGTSLTKDNNIPIQINPSIPCEWRWISVNTLACQFQAKNGLQPATRYEITVNPTLKTSDGETLGHAVKHTFTTQRPDIQYSWLENWSEPGLPVFVVYFNQKVTENSIKKHLFFTYTTNSTLQRLPIVISAYPQENLSQPIPDMDQPIKVGTDQARLRWVIAPRDPLPLNTAIALTLEPGLISAHGPASNQETRTLFQFHTYPEPKWLGFTCENLKGKKILIGPQDKNPEHCNPVSPVYATFNSPVSSQLFTKKWTLFKDNQAKEISLLNNENLFETELTPISGLHTADQRYTFPLSSSILQANQTYILKPRKIGTTLLTDQFGRTVDMPTISQFTTDHRPPNLILPYTQAVLEKEVPTDIPVYVTNLNSLTLTYNRLTTRGLDPEKILIHPLPPISDLALGIPLGIRQLFQETTGAAYACVSTTPTLTKKGKEPCLFVQVSPYQVQAKIGHFSSLVWVTDLKTGQPVADAKITLYPGRLETVHFMKQGQPVLAKAKTDAQGLASFPGTMEFDPSITLMRSSVENALKPLLMVEKGKDMAILPLTYPFAINTWQVSGSSFYAEEPQPKYSHLMAWGTTAQGIYQAGDRLQFKLYVRHQNDKHLIPAPKGPYELSLLDPSQKLIYHQPSIFLSDFGSYAGEIQLAKHVLTGWYSFKLKPLFSQPSSPPLTLIPMQVLISDFSPAPFQVETQINGDSFKVDQTVNIKTSAKLYGGGAYNQAAAKITVGLKSRLFSSTHPLAKSFYFGNTVRDLSKENYPQSDQILYQKETILDSQGENTQQVKLSPQPIVYGQIVVESSVQDDRGKQISAQAKADYFGVDRLVGLNLPQVGQAHKPYTLTYLTVDNHGQPIGDIPVSIILDKQINYAARVKGPGNAYLIRYHTEWKPIATCQGVSKKTGAMPCVFTPPEAGFYRVIAKIKDTQNHLHQTESHTYITGANPVLWVDNSDYTLPLVIEKSTLNIGDTLKGLIKNPYPGAKALITVERYGIIDRWVTTLEGNTPTLSIPIKPDYAPGFYVSVTVFSPRFQAALPKLGELDLGKPSFRIGYAKIDVKDPKKSLSVTAKTDKLVYRPGEMVELKLQSTEKKEKMEWAVIVIDESVFDLIQQGIAYFDPYRGFYKLSHLNLDNYSLLTQLVGQQRFEKKGANAGGDGGSTLGLRHTFKWVAYWNPNLYPNAQGKATVTFKVPDNLTRWRVLVLANTPTIHFGLSETEFKVNRPTEIRAVMPNQVHAGDRFQAGFSILNRTANTRTLNVSIEAKGPIDIEKTPNTKTSTVRLGSYERQTVYLPIQTKKLAASVTELHFMVKAKDEQDTDGLAYQIPVHPSQTWAVFADYGMTKESKQTLEVKFPQAIYPHSGKLDFSLSPTLLTQFQGAFQYLKEYPYTCWEQRLSKGLMAAYYQAFLAVFPLNLNWPESKELPSKTLEAATEFQTSGGGMAYFVPDDYRADPYLSAYTALAFNTLRTLSYPIPPPWNLNFINIYLNY